MKHLVTIFVLFYCQLGAASAPSSGQPYFWKTVAYQPRVASLKQNGRLLYEQGGYRVFLMVQEKDYLRLPDSSLTYIAEQERLVTSDQLEELHHVAERWQAIEDLRKRKPNLDATRFLLEYFGSKYASLRPVSRSAQHEWPHPSIDHVFLLSHRFYPQGRAEEALKKIEHFEVKFVKSCVYRLAMAIDFLHKHNFGHGDISASSVFIRGAHGDCVLGGFDQVQQLTDANRDGARSEDWRQLGALTFKLLTRGDFDPSRGEAQWAGFRKPKAKEFILSLTDAERPIQLGVHGGFKLMRFNEFLESAHRAFLREKVQLLGCD